MWWLVNDVAVVAQGVARWGSFFHGLALAVENGTTLSVQVWHFKGENARFVGDHTAPVTTFAQYMVAMIARDSDGNFAFKPVLGVGE